MVLFLLLGAAPFAGCASDEAGAASAYVLTPTMSVYSLGDVVRIDFDAFPGGVQDWIGIYTPGAAETAFIQFQYTGGTASGFVTFSGLPAGTYQARGYYNNSFVRQQTSANFTISSTSSSASITTDSSTYANGATIVTTFALTSPTGSDWIAIATVGSPMTSYSLWQYTGGGASGSRNFIASLPAGSYEARLFRNNSFSLAASSAAFMVTAAAAASVTATSVPANTPIPVAFSGFPGTATDWIAIADLGSTASQYRTWIYTGGGASGSVSVPGVPAGTYLVRGYPNNTFTIIAESMVTITAAAAACPCFTGANVSTIRSHPGGVYECAIDQSGGGTTTTYAASSTATYHYIAATYDNPALGGTNLGCEYGCVDDSPDDVDDCAGLPGWSQTVDIATDEHSGCRANIVTRCP